MNKIYALFFLFLMSSCTEGKKDNHLANPQHNDKLSAKLSTVLVTTETKKEEKFSFNKELREAVYFAKSVELEAFKLINKTDVNNLNSLFSVLSYVVEIKSGVKKTTLSGLSCNSFDTQVEGPQIRIFKTCLKNQIEVARIKTYGENTFAFEFFTKEWGDVLGVANALTGKNILCDVSLKNKKTEIFKCEDWSFEVGNNAQSPVIFKSELFMFSRSSAEQLKIQGQFYKDLVPYRKINIKVPLTGSIKVFEKEIEVIDEFAPKIEEQIEPKNTQPTETENTELNNTNQGVPSGRGR